LRFSNAKKPIPRPETGFRRAKTGNWSVDAALLLYYNNTTPNPQKGGATLENTVHFDKWDKRFMQMAWVISSWASCYQQDRKIGAVIVKNKRIVTTGYNGAPAGIKTCVERGECLRQKLGIASGTRAELCYAVHAEQNAIIQAARLGSSIDGATLYCTHQPCVLCAKMIVNAGIRRVVYREGYPDDFARQMLSEGGVALERFNPEENNATEKKT
jgi:dCMP deaminase